MAHNSSAQAEILKRVLDLSRLQVGHLVENRLVELIKCQQEREGLFESLREYPDESYKAPELKILLQDILESDRSITLNAESTMGKLKDKFSQIKKGSKALKAYSPR